jgi:DNA-binding transcriptional regulator YiaG
MKTAYIDQMYKDFNNKVETILKYLTLMQEKTKSTTKDIVDFVKLYETLYTDLSSAKNTVVTPQNTQFAIEQKETLPIQIDSSKIKEISEAIETNTPLIEYKFEDLLRNLQFTTQAFQNYQEMTNKIVEAWEEALGLLQG